MTTKELIKNLKREIKENRGDIKLAIKNGRWAAVMHLESVNGVLDYVIWKLKELK